MTVEEKRRECFFWLREYMWRGGYGLFAGEGDKTLSPSEILENIQAGKPLPFSGQFLGSCPPAYLFKAVMPYVWHRNAEGRIANKILGPIANPERSEEGDIEPVVIDYSLGVDRAIIELRALFDFHSGDWENAAFSLVAEEYNSQTINASTPRAIGLWIWDYIEKKHAVVAKNFLMIGNPDRENKSKYQNAPRGSVSEAIREFENQFDLIALGVEKVESSDLRFFYNKTDQCIKDCRVYPFSKRGTQKRKVVPRAIKSKSKPGT